MTLMLHAGAVPVTLTELRDLPEPQYTRTHRPVSHATFIDAVSCALQTQGHTVTSQAHGMTKDGSKYFGLLSLRSENAGYEDAVGLRNSHDKTFPAGIGFGSRVFVCDNMAFVADHVLKRKHTARIHDDLFGLIMNLIKTLDNQRRRQHDMYNRYKSTPLSDRLADHAIMRMYRENVINVQRIPIVQKEWDSPSFEGFGDHTAWSLFNATTYALEGRVLDNPKATPHLHTILNDVCEYAE